MALRMSELWDWRGATGRAAYLAWGVGLMAARCNLDRLLAWNFSHRDWNRSSYWRLWSDYLVHRIPARVLDRIRAQAEQDRQG